MEEVPQQTSSLDDPTNEEWVVLSDDEVTSAANNAAASADPPPIEETAENATSSLNDTAPKVEECPPVSTSVQHESLEAPQEQPQTEGDEDKIHYFQSTPPSLVSSNLHQELPLLTLATETGSSSMTSTASSSCPPEQSPLHSTTHYPIPALNEQQSNLSQTTESSSMPDDSSFVGLSSEDLFSKCFVIEPTEYEQRAQVGKSSMSSLRHAQSESEDDAGEVDTDGRLALGQSRLLLPEVSKHSINYDKTLEGLSVLTIQPETVMENPDVYIRRCRVTQGNGVPKEEKVILLLGATGAGKTSLMNSMANYLMGVTWTGGQRVRLQPHESDTSSATARSQTRWISAYTFEHQPGFQVPFSVTIIDTPGMGDTEGIARDMDICRQLKYFLEKDPPFGLDHIDAVCYVVKSSENRLGAAMSYSINEILKLFSKDVGEVFHLFTTFHDGTRPCALDAMAAAKVQYQHHFLINNSSFYAATHEPYAKLQQVHFDTANASLKEFFQKVEASRENPCSLLLTREVMRERQQLQSTLDGIAIQIQIRISEMKESAQEVRLLQSLEEEAAKHENFTYTVEQTHFDLVSTGGFSVTNCTQCQMTCCEGCRIYFNKLKWFCAAIDRSGRCKTCPSHCFWWQHHNPSAKFVPRVEVVTRTLEDMKRKYEMAVEGQRDKKELLARIQRRREGTEAEVMQMIARARQSLQRLNEIALRNSSVQTSEYVDMLIADEKAQMSPGWQERVEQLNHLKAKIELKYLFPVSGATTTSGDDEADRRGDGPTGFSFLGYGDGAVITPSFVQDCSNQLPLFE